MSRIDELFQEVWRRPDDVELRLVLCDALLEAGDPRGELIQLQRHPHADQGQRVMRLLQRYGLTWLGSLRGAVLPQSYELGFLASCVAIDAAAVGRPEWATVHTVELGVDAVDFLFDPVMRSLRRVAGVRDVHIGPLLRAPRCPPELEARLPWDRLPMLHARLDRVPALRAFHLPELRLSRDDSGHLGALDVSDVPRLRPLLEDLPADCLTRLVVRDVAPEHREPLEHLARASQRRLTSLHLLAPGQPSPGGP